MSRTPLAAFVVWFGCSLCGPAAALAQDRAQPGPIIDLTGEWAAQVHEDAPYRGPGGFLGDYTGMDAIDDAHPVWADTRAPDLFLCPGTGTPGTPPDVCLGTESAGPQTGLTANDEDIFTAGVNVPNN